MKEQLIINTTSFASGGHRRIIDLVALRSLPVPNCDENILIWWDMFECNPGATIDKLGTLEKLNIAWASTLGAEMLKELE